MFKNKCDPVKDPEHDKCDKVEVSLGEEYNEDDEFQKLNDILKQEQELENELNDLQENDEDTSDEEMRDVEINSDDDIPATELNSYKELSE